MKKHAIIFMLMLSLITINAQNYYDQVLPGEQAIVFAPSSISLDNRLEQDSNFSSDAKQFCFSITNRAWNEGKIQITELINDTWTTPQDITFQNAADAWHPFFSPDGNELYFSGRNLESIDIYKSVKTDTGWSLATPLEGMINSSSDEWYPTLSNDKTLYFSKGGDIYYSKFVNGSYLEIVKLPATINTYSNEYDPFIAPNGSYMIFCSSKPGGFGRTDMYITYWLSSCTWSEPINLGQNINSEHTDFAPTVTPDGKNIMFTRSNRQRTSSDIYWASIEGIVNAHPDSLALNELKIVYLDFESTVADKKVPEHLALYLNNDVNVNILAKSDESFNFLERDAFRWSRSFSRPWPYRVDISETEFELYGNTALSIARFDEVERDVPNGYGIDLFLYTKTTNGWKYATLNNTYSDLNDNFDYSSLPISNTPLDRLNDVQLMLNQDNGTGFLELFSNTNAPCFTINNPLNTDEPLKYTVTDFVDLFFSKDFNLSIEIDNSEFEFFDDFLAKSISNFTLKSNTETFAIGKAIATYIATPSEGWKLSALVFSVQEEFEESHPLTVEHNNLDNLKSINLYPNPAKKNLKIEMNQTDLYPIKIELIDMIGRKQTLYESTGTSSGSLSFNHDVSQLSKGLYFVRIAWNGKSFIKKLIVAK
ncbi:T9SS type A sorting domain-containing protein [uncultured Algibacter sp.]|uniref:T9SS type A sorting domain-containing protein n=1 Tax=uncultured Algibacter sp. TaxID=298659 RepID=UPI002614ECE5|nr:T9SS type A sorting domain-containing protein [uncultured Algibacter sp.]